MKHLASPGSGLPVPAPSDSPVPSGGRQGPLAGVPPLQGSIREPPRVPQAPVLSVPWGLCFSTCLQGEGASPLSPPRADSLPFPHLNPETGSHVKQTGKKED